MWCIEYLIGYGNIIQGRDVYACDEACSFFKPFGRGYRHGLLFTPSRLPHFLEVNLSSPVVITSSTKTHRLTK